MSDSSRYLKHRNSKLDSLLRKLSVLGAFEFLADEEQKFMLRCAAELRIETGLGHRVFTRRSRTWRATGPTGAVEPTGSAGPTGS